LAVFDSQGLQLIGDLVGLDHFGDGLQLHRPAQIDEPADQALRHGIAQPPDQIAVDLDRVHRQFADIVIGGRAGAEVVDADLDARLAQGGQASVRRLQIRQG